MGANIFEGGGASMIFAFSGRQNVKGQGFEEIILDRTEPLSFFAYY